jgi:hypothetical protein
MSTPTPGPTRVRSGKFAVHATDGALAEFDCDPTSVVWTPSAGDTGDALEVLCGTTIPGDAGPTTWTLAITSVQRLETTNTNADSLVLWALENDGKVATAYFQPSSTAKIFSGQVSVVALPLGGEVGPTRPTSDIEWPSEKPSIIAAWPTE